MTDCPYIPGLTHSTIGWVISGPGMPGYYADVHAHFRVFTEKGECEKLCTLFNIAYQHGQARLQDELKKLLGVRS